MASLYGGLPGAPFVIKDSFQSISKMTDSFKNSKYKDTWYGEYCIIDASINDPDNGKVYQRTQSGAKYVGRFVGPSGFIDSFQIENSINTGDNITGDIYYSTYKDEQAGIGHVNNGLIRSNIDFIPAGEAEYFAGASGNNNESKLQYAWYLRHYTEGQGENAKEKNDLSIGLKIPYQTHHFFVANGESYSEADIIEHTSATDENVNNLYKNWTITVPKGDKGVSVREIFIKEAGALNTDTWYMNKICSYIKDNGTDVLVSGYKFTTTNGILIDDENESEPCKVVVALLCQCDTAEYPELTANNVTTWTDRDEVIENVQEFTYVALGVLEEIYEFSYNDTTGVITSLGTDGSTHQLNSTSPISYINNIQSKNPNNDILTRTLLQYKRNTDAATAPFTDTSFAINNIVNIQLDSKTRHLYVLFSDPEYRVEYPTDNSSSLTAVQNRANFAKFPRSGINPPTTDSAIYQHYQNLTTFVGETGESWWRLGTVNKIVEDGGSISSSEKKVYWLDIGAVNSNNDGILIGKVLDHDTYSHIFADWANPTKAEIIAYLTSNYPSGLDDPHAGQLVIYTHVAEDDSQVDVDFQSYTWFFTYNYISNTDIMAENNLGWYYIGELTETDSNTDSALLEGGFLPNEDDSYLSLKTNGLAFTYYNTPEEAIDDLDSELTDITFSSVPTPFLEIEASE